jgi:hypothetical protein
MTRADRKRNHDKFYSTKKCSKQPDFDNGDQNSPTMPRSRKINLEKVRASLDAVCPKCAGERMQQSSFFDKFNQTI